MELKEIAVVSGKPGLYKIVKPAVNGVILEALDGSMARFIAGTATKVSVLGEISVYTENGENIPLESVFRTIYAKYEKSLSVGAKSSDNELRTFFTDLIPEHDKQRVYNSDIKKIAVWYSTLVTVGFEENFSKKEEVTEDAQPKKEKKAAKKETETTEVVAAEAPKKEKATKAATEKKEVKETAEKKTAKAPVAKKATK